MEQHPPCTHNLTQPLFAPYTAVQGEGWLEGDFSAVAFSTSHANLLLRLNTTNTTAYAPPRLGVAVRTAGGATLVASALIDVDRVSNISVDLRHLNDGEYPVSIEPDSASLVRGWCGALPRVLRKQQELSQHRGSSTVAPGSSPRVLPLRINQPILFFDDYFVDNRSGLVRRLLRPTKQRVGNASFLARGLHPWQKVTRGLTLDAQSGLLSFAMAVNYGSATPPSTSDPTAEQFHCTKSLDRSGSGWSCVAEAKPVAPAGVDGVGSAKQGGIPTTTSPWPPPALPGWDPNTTHVRHYRPSDGPVDVTALSIYWVPWRDHEPAVYGNVTLYETCGYPIWQRTSDGERQTLVLPVDGVAGRPLLHADIRSEVSHGLSLEAVCRDAEHCACAGPNVTDIGCANDNFGGEWVLPPGAAGVVDELSPTFVHAQGRVVSAFAPHAAGFDNLATIRRVLVTWSTRDGLQWEQRWWRGGGKPSGPAPYAEAGVPGHYGADNFCAEAAMSPRGGCRAAHGSYDGSPLLSWVMPYDAARQQFWQDLAYSSDGVTFSSVEEEREGGGGGGDATPPMVPNGAIGEWDGGLLMGIGPGVNDGAGRTHSLLLFADSGAHFMFVFRSLTNLSTASVRAKGESEFFGHLLPSRWHWFSKNGGWEGVARVARNLSIEIGQLSWRTEGWVALKAAESAARLVTRPISLRDMAGGGGCATASLSLSANYRGGAATVELLDAAGEPIDGYSGADAATIEDGSDGVALALRFGPSRVSQLPAAVRGPGVGVRATLARAGSELFGLSLRCAD
jgi:hypothetical protein